jgi:hypothetical protein
LRRDRARQASSGEVLYGETRRDPERQGRLGIVGFGRV